MQAGAGWTAADRFGAPDRGQDANANRVTTRPARSFCSLNLQALMSHLPLAVQGNDYLPRPGGVLYNLDLHQQHGFHQQRELHQSHAYARAPPHTLMSGQPTYGSFPAPSPMMVVYPHGPQGYPAPPQVPQLFALPMFTQQQMPRIPAAYACMTTDVTSMTVPTQTVTGVRVNLPPAEPAYPPQVQPPSHSEQIQPMGNTPPSRYAAASFEWLDRARALLDPPLTLHAECERP
eukprot:7276813-Prymnesium_polylepis.1